MLPRVAKIRPEERRGAAAAFLTIFGILAAHTLLETARDALFLARLPATQLPWVYMAIAGASVLLYEGPMRRRRPGLAYRLPWLLSGFAAVTFGFWAFAPWTSRAALYALYTWTGVVGGLAVMQFWLVLSERYTVGQAKRIYSRVGTGALLGAVTGATVARFATVAWGAPSLVLLAAAVMFATALGPALLLRWGTEEGGVAVRGSTSLADAFKVMGGHAYLRGLAGLVLVSSVALTLGDYVFKSAVARNVPAAELGSFFATVYAVVNLLALFVQVLVADWLFRTLGLHRALWALPLLVLVGAAGFALGGGLAAALLLKGADGALRNSVHRTGTELLFVPLPDGLRARTKPLIDLLGQRGGQALASLLILSEAVLQRGDAVLAAAASALCLVWVAWAADLRGHYLNLFRAALREGSITPSLDLPPLDLGSLETLFAALNSSDDAEVLGAVELLAEEGRTRLIPALILYHPSAAVVIRCLDLFARSGRTDFVSVADRLLEHPDPEVRATALRARSAVSNNEALLRSAREDASPLVRATAVVGLVSGGWVTDDAQQALDELLKEGTAEAQVALARAIRAQPAAAFSDLLLRLVDSPDPAVQVEAALAMGAVKSEAFLPALLPLLADRDTRTAARSALLAHGGSALAFLDQTLEDEALPHEIRRHLPRTISLFSPPEAAGVLLRHLTREKRGWVRYKILRGLNRLTKDPEVVLDRTVLRRAVEATLEAAFRLVDWRLTLHSGAAAEPHRRTPGHELLISMLRDKEVHAVERIFRMLSLLFRGEDFKNIHRGLRNKEPKVRAGSRELLENIVHPPLRGPLVALVDDAPDAERLARAQPFYTPRPLDYEALLSVILEESSEAMRCIAAYHVAELGLTRFQGRLEAIRGAKVGLFLSRVAERALSLLREAGGQRVVHAG